MNSEGVLQKLHEANMNVKINKHRFTNLRLVNYIVTVAVE